MEKVLATEKYCTNIHGAVLWDLTSKCCKFGVFWRSFNNMKFTT
jgi:hypothetical protein